MFLCASVGVEERLRERKRGKEGEGAPGAEDGQSGLFQPPRAKDPVPAC
jgi:hypothetical protein